MRMGARVKKARSGILSVFPTTAATPPFTFPSIDTFAAIREVYRVLFLSPIDA
jgi:hypothetical protein